MKNKIDPAHVEHIETFAAGEPVPEWLIFVDPTKAQTARLDMVFNVPTAVVKVWGEFWLLPQQTTGGAIIRGDGNGGSYALTAADAPIVMPMAYSIMGRPGGRDLHLRGER